MRLRFNSDPGFRPPGFFPILNAQNQSGTASRRLQKGFGWRPRCLADDLNGWYGLRLLELSMRLVEIRMVLRKAIIFCLKRCHLTGNEPDLASGFVLWRVAVHHPVQVVNVLLEACHMVELTISHPDAKDQNESRPREFAASAEQDALRLGSVLICQGLTKRFFGFTALRFTTSKQRCFGSRARRPFAGLGESAEVRARVLFQLLAPEALRISG